ncbi:MAG: HDOD domain-containing protein [Opitutales bacterium]|nr:HDOD domain-containing protein [Opitutales bacterium]NRA28417.1 HDOD domain-containing protein [Opitutales bacterium]
MNKEAAQNTITLIEDHLKRKESATVGRVIHLIQQLAEKALIISTQELGELISSDVTVTKKVIETANKLAYNQSGAEITTVTQAIGLIGFSKIRNLALSLLLIENSENKMNLAEQREVSAFALCSGLMSQKVIEKTDQELAEQSFICTTLRNYGRLLMSTFMIEDFREAQLFATEKTEDEAFTDIFGLTPIELSFHLLESSRLPAEITHCLKKVRSEQIRRAARSTVEKVSVVADFSMKLCDMAMFSDLSPDAFDARSKKLLKNYQANIPLDGEEILGLLKEVHDAVNDFCSEYEIEIMPENLANSMEARSKGKSPPVKPRRIEPARKAEQKISALKEAIGSLRKLIANPPFDATRAYMIALEAYTADQGLDDCILLIRKPGTDSFFQNIGCGKLFYATRKRNIVKATNPDVFGLCIQRRKDIIFASATEKKDSELPTGLAAKF